MTRRINVVALIAGVALAGSLACTSKQTAPSISGPSELATAITLYASPDTITQDGAAQSQITIQARDARNQPIANLPIRLDASGLRLDDKGNPVAAAVADVGQLSTSQIVTGGDGRATASYTAPNAPRTAADGLWSVMILATPVGTDASGALPRNVTIRLTSSTFPTSTFSFSQGLPYGGRAVTFNGSASSSPYGISSYVWDFGDGATATGMTSTHAYAVASLELTYAVRLTVTDRAGQTSISAPQSIVVKAGNGMTAAFTFSPTDPTGAQEINFNASDSAGPNAISTYSWDFGDGSTGSGLIPSPHAFVGCTTSATNTTDQTFVVRLSVTDSAGQVATVAKNVIVKKCKL